MYRLRMAATALTAFSLAGLLAAPLAASAQTMAEKTYEVKITNLTAKQPLSPPVVAAHPASVHVWQEGQPASEGVRMVAEEGDGSVLASSLKGSATDVQQGSGLIMPGNSFTVRIMAHDGDVLSAAMMLGATNDGFTGLDNLALGGQAVTRETMAYDAGTEENTETAADVPGLGGHMHGTPTTPRGTIAPHPGVKGTADLTADFGWSGPVARIVVKPVEGTMAAPTAGESMGGAAGGASTSMPGMPDTGAAMQDQPMQDGAMMDKGDSMMSNNSNLPATGTADNTGLVIAAAVAGLLLLAGASVLSFAYKRR